ncbi:hypothetical protein RvY_16176 [Ramazzottius varieornatus]|uniref:Expansin-like EG45 domain-containing protein n=1 Tax=Ramazzottius varieornatus TaxID=947166 RepID=A0A1D1VXJ0_RAMVA|nr:hypothetical protein RvY_16176 [Ramazzottius varieornatus]
MSFLRVCLCFVASSMVFTGAHGSGKATYYNPSDGLGACGFLNSDSEKVAAVSPDTYDRYGKLPNPNDAPICRKCATVTSRKSGATVTVRIVDKCPGCQTKHIDLSPAAFKKLAPLHLGVIPVDWYLHDC